MSETTPKSAELTAAARSLRDDFLPLSPLAAKAIATVTDYVLATVAADDDEPIDEAWLSKFMRIGGGGSFTHPELTGYIESSDSGEFWRWVVESMILCVMNTRGELRRLFVGLHIALQPIEQETQS